MKAVRESFPAHQIIVADGFYELTIATQHSQSSKEFSFHQKPFATRIISPSYG